MDGPNRPQTDPGWTGPLQAKLADKNHTLLAHCLCALAYAASAHGAAARLTHLRQGVVTAIGSDQPMSRSTQSPFRSPHRLRTRRLLDRLQSFAPGPRAVLLTAGPMSRSQPTQPPLRPLDNPPGPALPTPTGGNRSTAGLIVPAGRSRWTAYLLERVASEPPFCEQDLAYLQGVADPLSACWEQSLAATLDPPGKAASLQTGVLDKLSDMERKVARQLIEGQTEQAVAESLQRSRHTIHVHVKSVYRKLGVSKRAELRQGFAQALQQDPQDHASEARDRNP
ncbi:MAG: LuxR C-terminal-related transcriptional regulator [Planctomycetota bacterium]